MNDIYVTRTEQYCMGQDFVSRRLADFLVVKLQADGLHVTCTETTRGITVSGSMVICLGGVTSIPTSDAVMVTRCKECVHRPKQIINGRYHGLEFPDEQCPACCDDPWYSWMPEDDFYCAFGERER